MIIRVEPKDWSMYSVLMYFDAQSPDAEDEAIKEYLSDHNLVAKKKKKQQLEDREFDIMSFGGCYLGRRHMNAVAEIQKGVVERELLVDKIPELLNDGPNPDASRRASELDENELQNVLDILIEKHQEQSSFGQDNEGFLQVTLNAAVVQESFLEIVTTNS